MAGLEPASAGVKVPCLTTWRHPTVIGSNFPVFVKTDFGVSRFSRGHFEKNDPPPFGDHTPTPGGGEGDRPGGGVAYTPLPLAPPPMARVGLFFYCRCCPASLPSCRCCYPTTITCRYPPALAPQGLRPFSRRESATVLQQSARIAVLLLLLIVPGPLCRQGAELLICHGR